MESHDFSKGFNLFSGDSTVDWIFLRKIKKLVIRCILRIIFFAFFNNLFSNRIIAMNRSRNILFGICQVCLFVLEISVERRVPLYIVYFQAIHSLTWSLTWFISRMRFQTNKLLSLSQKILMQRCRDIAFIF